MKSKHTDVLVGNLPKSAVSDPEHLVRFISSSIKTTFNSSARVVKCEIRDQSDVCSIHDSNSRGDGYDDKQTTTRDGPPVAIVQFATHMEAKRATKLQRLKLDGKTLTIVPWRTTVKKKQTHNNNNRYSIFKINNRSGYDDIIRSIRDNNGNSNDTKNDTNGIFQLGGATFRSIPFLCILGFLSWNLYFSINIKTTVEDLSHTLPTELALAVERRLASSRFLASTDSNSTISSNDAVASAWMGLRNAATDKSSYQSLQHHPAPRLPPHIVVSSTTNTVPSSSSATKHPQKLQKKLDNLYFQNGRFYDPEQDGMLWDVSDFVPMWMREYFNWQKSERIRLEEEIEKLKAADPAISDSDMWDKLTNRDKGAAIDQTFKFMVMQCIDGQDRKCGGTADRLKIFVYWIQQACEANRLLLIYWTSPKNLEEFLVPPIGGYDWRVPDFMKTILHIREHGSLYHSAKTYVQFPRIYSQPTALIRFRVQSPTGLEHYYDDRNETYSRKRVKTINEPNEYSFAEIYHDVFRIFFRPSKGIEQQIHQVLGYPFIKTPLEPLRKQPYLLPGYFAAIHVRALYARDTVDQRIAKDIAINGLKCATKLRPGGPFFMASDHQYVIKSAEDFLVSEKHLDTKVLVRFDDASPEDPIHLGFVQNVTQRHPSEFYDTFVDIWVLGMSECLVYNQGGFGTWGLLIGYNSKCSINQYTVFKGPKVRCEDWISPNEKQAIANDETYTHLPPLFVDPL